MIRKLGKALRGGATFSQVSIGVFLGFAIGMMPGLSLSLILLIALLLLLNVNGGGASVALIFGKILCLVLAPLTFNIGYTLIHSIGLEGLIRTISDTPILALLDFQVYCLTGAIPIIVIFGSIAAIFTAKFFVKFQEATAKANSENDKYQKIMNNKIMKAILWLAFGKKKEVKEDEKKKNNGLILKSRIIAGIVATFIICIFSYLYADVVAKHAVISSIEAMSGSEVNVKSASISLLSGRFKINNLQVTNPETPTTNSIQAEEIIADIDVKALLTRQFVADEISCTAFKTGAKSSSAGEVYVKVEPKKEEPASENLNTAQRIKLYYTKIKEVKKKIDNLNKFLDSNDPATAVKDSEDKKLSKKEMLKEKARLKGYLSLSAKDILSKHPTWLIRKISINKLSISPELPTMIVVGKNISSAPSLVTEKRSIVVKPDKEAIAELKKKFGGKTLDKIKEGVGSKLKGLFGK